MSAITGKEGVASFNTETDYIAPPMVPVGTYNGVIKNVKLDGARLLWAVELIDNNGSFCDDGETPVDANMVFFNCWLPLDGDDQQFMSKTSKKPYEGGVSRHQFKVNQLARFAVGMRIDKIVHPGIEEKIESGEYLEKEVIIVVKHDEYMGNVTVQGDKLKAR